MDDGKKIKQETSQTNKHREHKEAFFQTQIDASGDGVFSVDNVGNILLADRVSRLNLDIHPGNSLLDKFPLLWERITETLKGKHTQSDITEQKENHKFRVTISPILAGTRIFGAICVFSENTELEVISREMHALRELSNELEVIIDCCSEGLWVCDGQANVLRINMAAERINNINAEDVIGRNMYNLVSEGFIKRSATIETIESKKAVRFICRTNDGRKLIMSGTPIFDDSGQVVKVIVSERDISEIDKAQRQLEEQAALNNEFQQRILEMQKFDLVSNKIIARSPAMIKALTRAVKVSQADSSVLILGESGTGKSMFADLIHQRSQRANKPLIKINCGAIPETLIESELFGHEKGAFTGASSEKPGHIELADGGVLFLDEIAELPLSSQVRLLHVLEDGNVTRLGATKSKQVDVRILAATHGDLQDMVKQKTFRLDLFYRLNVIPLYIPSLRDREDCIVPLIQYHVDLFNQQSKTNKRITSLAMDALLAYDWPGNVRQLINICERILVLAENDVIDLQDLPREIVADGTQKLQSIGHLSLPQAVDSFERSLLVDAMEKYGSQYKIARALKVHQSTIARKLKRYNILSKEE